MDPKAHIYQFDNVKVDAENFRVWKADETVQMEPKAFQVLLFLIENRGRLIEKRELLDAVWKETFVTENALTREIAQLRKALGESAREAKYIETVPTKGYRFVAEVEVKNGRRTNGEVKEEKAVALVEEIRTNERASILQPAGEAVKGRETKRAWQLKSLNPLVLIGAIVFLIVGGIFLWRYIKRSASDSVTVRRLAQLTTWAGLDIYPSLSPDGSSIAYSSDHNGNFEIYVRQLASGGQEIQITSDGGQNTEPAWSPDGQYIAYHSRSNGGIWIVPSLGGSARRLTEFGSKPAWSHDGSMIVFQSESSSDLNGSAFGALPPSTIWTIPSRGGEAKQITRMGTPPGGHGSPTWSPDGRRIVFLASDTSQTAIWSVSAAGNDLKPLTTDQLYFDPVYAPDGEAVYCVGISKNVYGLWRIQVSQTGERSGDPQEVQGAGTQPIRNLSISANGKKIAYSARSLTSDIWSVPLSPATSEAISDPLPLLQDRSARKTNPSISPDGKRIALGVWRVGVPGSVLLMDADGRNQTQVATTNSTKSLPHWLSNDEVTFVTYKERDALLSAINLKTGVERQLATLAPDIDFSRVSPDGKQLAYNSSKSGTINVWKIGIENGRPMQLTFDQELAGWPSWSPDGKLIAFELKRGDDTHIAIIPSDGGEIRQLTFEHGQSWPHSWSPDGEHIAFAGFRNGIWNIYWVSVKDGSIKQLTRFNKLNSYVRYPEWSPTGNQIVFEYAEMTGNIWMMELK
jgi:Tol biopolymer transport system component/DNA-binding winged helix-turn-helix (wHTH) protein